MKTKIVWFVFAISTVISAASLKYLPDTIPIHYDFNGAVDGYASKESMFLFPAAMILTIIIYSVVSRMQTKAVNKDPENKKAVESKNNQKILDTSMNVLAIMLLFLQMAMLYTVLKATANNSPAIMPDESYSFIAAIMGMVFIILGNIMPKAKKNSLFGIKTPWSMANDKTWSMSNRFGGFALLISGVIMIVSALIFDGLVIMYIFVTTILIAAALSIAYSYSAYKKHGKE
ncbi:MAG: SdpI family protein [Oscillospiraceae bacterium]|nr:SdpI family protein [Oscillospiraceae bacterium]